jgi:hypothetical protein
MKMMDTILSYSNKTCMSGQPDCADLNKVATYWIWLSSTTAKACFDFLKV